MLGKLSEFITTSHARYIDSGGKQLKARSIILACAVLLLQLSWKDACWSQSDAYFLSPGIKLAYAFGQNGGFVVGLELSFYRVISIRGEDQGFAGFLVDIDKCKDLTKVHFGIEASYRLVGASIGPSLLFNQEWQGFGMTGTLYSWVLVLPYYGYTYVFERSDIHELGVYVKLPIQISGRPFFDFRVGG
jgi:hypothetical protein